MKTRNGDNQFHKQNKWKLLTNEQQKSHENAKI